MRNVEIKAKVVNLKQLLAEAKKLAGKDAITIKQHDTFYNVPNGRLKLRRLLDVSTQLDAQFLYTRENSIAIFQTGKGELIFYDRPNIEGPKLSLFQKTDVDSENLNGLNEVLVKALGAKNDVKKTRHLFLVNQTRVHVDEVENLGHFMELEVTIYFCMYKATETLL